MAPLQPPPEASPPEEETYATTLVLSAEQPRLLGAKTQGILTVMSGVDAGMVVTLQPGRSVTLGRALDCTISFADMALSRVHARVMMHGDMFVLKDDGSRNGTLVNGKRLTEPVYLADGDKINLGAETSLRFSLVSEAEEAALRKTYEGATRDGLTGVFNRQQFDKRIELAIKAAHRENQSLSLVMVDIDHFKKVNDTHGHPGGDEVLRAAARVFAGGVHPGDLVARYGGEEFVLVMRNCDAMSAGLVADQIRTTLSQQSLQYGGQTIRVTCSMGVASLDECSMPSLAELVRRADERLYKAKQGGRNRVVGPF